MNEKDKELLEFKEAARSEAEEVNRLQAENKKLREALELCKQEAMRPAYVITICKEALKEVGQE